jgi:hypothetical protein
MARQDRDSQYGGGSYNSEKNNSGRTQSYGGDNNRENYRNTPAAKASAKKAATISKANKIKNDATAFDNYKYTKKFTPSILGMTLNVTGLAEKGFYANKSYYEKNVMGKNNFTKSIDSYKDYMKKRGSGEIDAMGRPIVDFRSGENDGNTQPGITKNIGGSTIQTTAPTTAEVSQSEAANADAAALKVKKRGRSASIMTSAKGVTKTSTDYSLGKKSLLGRV